MLQAPQILGLARSSDISVCSSSTAQQRGKDECLWSEGRLKRSLDGKERARSFALLLSVVVRLLGALGLLDVLLSVGGESFVAPFSTAPQALAQGYVVFPLCSDVAVGQVGEHKRKYAAMLQSSSRQASKCRCSLSFSSFFLSLGGWCSRSRFSRDGPHGAHLADSRPDGIKDSSKFSGGRAYTIF